MSKRKTKAPLSSFGSELYDALRQGAAGEKRITLPSPGAAVNFRQRLNMLRSTMREEGYTDWQQYYRVGVYIDPTNPSVVILRAKDSEYRDALKAAGIQLTTDPAPTAPEPAADNDLETFLKSLKDPDL
jgi:hypothetical protein